MIDNQTMEEFVLANPNVVQRKETSIPGLYVLKYKNKVFYKNLWNDFLLECRGTVVDEDYNVVVRPFTKIFNRGENGTDIDRDEYCLFTRKVNGFMAAATWYNDDLIVSTTGSLDSEFAKLAHSWVLPYWKNIRNLEGYTFIFEIVDPSDPHIIEEEFGVYLLAIRKNKWNCDNNAFNQPTLDTIAYNAGFKRPEYFYNRFSDVVKDLKYVKHEGYVVYSLESGKELKLKSPFYKTTKFLARMKDEKLIDNLDNPERLKKCIDEEFYGIIDYLGKNLNDFLMLDEQGRVEYVRNYFYD